MLRSSTPYPGMKEVHSEHKKNLDRRISLFALYSRPFCPISFLFPFHFFFYVSACICMHSLIHVHVCVHICGHIHVGTCTCGALSFMLGTILNCSSTVFIDVMSPNQAQSSPIWRALSLNLFSGSPVHVPRLDYRWNDMFTWHHLCALGIRVLSLVGKPL